MIKKPTCNVCKQPIEIQDLVLGEKRQGGLYAIAVSIRPYHNNCFEKVASNSRWLKDISKNIYRNYILFKQYLYILVLIVAITFLYMYGVRITIWGVIPTIFFVCFLLYYPISNLIVLKKSKHI